MAQTSKQLAVLKRLTAHLEGTEVDGGDLTGRVFRGRTTLGTNIKYPALAMLEPPAPLQNPGDTAAEHGIKRSEGWRIALQGFAEDDPVNPSDPAYELKAKVEERLSQIILLEEESGDPVFPNAYLLGRLINGLVIGQGIVRPPEANVSATAFFYMPLLVKIATNVSKPYVDS